MGKSFYMLKKKNVTISANITSTLIFTSTKDLMDHVNYVGSGKQAKAFLDNTFEVVELEMKILSRFSLVPEKFKLVEEKKNKEVNFEH